MVEAAIADNLSFECSKIEIDRGGKSYSYHTICALKEHYHLSKENLFVIIGTDNFESFQTWYKPQEILSICSVVVFPRNRVNLDLMDNEFYSKILYLDDAPLLEISSSMIRDRIRNGFSIKYFVPPAVQDIILSGNLYSEP